MTKVSSDLKFSILSALGALVILYGYFQITPQMYYVLGSLGLLITAIHYKLTYFIALELILVAGHAAILLNLGPYTQLTLPVFLCIQLLFFYFMLDKNTNVFLLLGIIGIALLSMGFSYNNQWIFFGGGLCIATYAYYLVYNGTVNALIWAILNSLFALIALYKIILN